MFFSQLRLWTTVVALCASVGALAAGCGGNPPPVDAGTDAPLDAEVPLDAETPADVPVPADAADGAPPPDAGPPDPVGVAGRMTRMHLMTVIAERDAIPVGERTAAVFADLDIAIGRLDAIIGEKGLLFTSGIIGEKGRMMALALSDRAVPAIVIVRELHRLLAQFDRISRGLDRVPRTSLRSAVDATIRSLDSLRTELVARFRELANDPAIMPVRDEAFSRSLQFEAPTPGVAVHGRFDDRVDGQATVSWDCGLDEMTITVYDDETGAMLAGPVVGAGMQQASIRRELDDPIALRVEVVQMVPDPIWDHCSMTISGRRRYRGPPIDLNSSVDALGEHSLTWSSHMSQIERALVALSSAPPEVQEHLPLVVDIVGQLAATHSMWRPPPPSIGPDDLQILRVTLDLLVPAAMATRDHPHYSASTYADLRIALGNLISVTNAVRSVLRI